MNETWKAKASTLAETGALSWRQIADALKLPKSTVSDYLRKQGVVPTEEAEKVNVSKVLQEHDNSRILFISDMHIPYHHSGLLPFLDGLKKRYEPTRVICLGDELDKHALSFHDSDPDLDSAGPELEKSRPVIEKLKSMFPDMDIIESNHGSLVFRKAKHHGIPRHYIKSYNDVLGVDDRWKWHKDMTITLPDGQDVYIHHGKLSSAVRVSQAMGMSFVCGHYHEKFGIEYWANPRGLYWAMNTGCLVDDDSLAFAYNNTNLKRPIVGTGLVIDGIPILEAMPM